LRVYISSWISHHVKTSLWLHSYSRSQNEFGYQFATCSPNNNW